MSVAPSLALAGPAEIQVFLRRRARGQRWFFAGVAVIALVVAAVAGKGDPAAFVVAGGFVAVMALFTYVGRRRLAARWRGEVVRKEVREIRHRKADVVACPRCHCPVPDPARF
jgi:hypothetical protein